MRIQRVSRKTRIKVSVFIGLIALCVLLLPLFLDMFKKAKVITELSGIGLPASSLNESMVNWVLFDPLLSPRVYCTLSLESAEEANGLLSSERLPPLEEKIPINSNEHFRLFQPEDETPWNVEGLVGIFCIPDNIEWFRPIMKSGGFVAVYYETDRNRRLTAFFDAQEKKLYLTMYYE